MKLKRKLRMRIRSFPPEIEKIDPKNQICTKNQLAILYQKLRYYISLQRREYSVQITAYRVQRTEYSVQSTAYRVQRTEYSVQSKAYRVKRTEYSVQSTVTDYSIQSTTYRLQSTE